MRASTLIAFLTIALCGLATAGAAGAQRLAFTKLVQGSSKLVIPGGQISYETSALVIDPLGASIRPGDLQLELKDKDINVLSAVPWRRQFVLGVLSALPTRGYRISIMRVSLQHIGGGAVQLCVVASRQGPGGRVVLQEATSAYSFVAVDRASHGTPAPTTVVVRGIHGRLLFVTQRDGPFDSSSHHSRPDVCRPA